MKKKVKIISIIAACLLAAIPTYAVFNEKDLSQTLSVLRFELKEQNTRMENARQMMMSRNEMQHKEMVKMAKTCNELSLILYSQRQDYTFDLTYALREVTEKYEQFSRDTMPYSEILNSLDLEVERYEKLIESLKRLPPRLVEYPDSLKDAMMDRRPQFLNKNIPSAFMLDEEAQVDRDSCIFYAENMLSMYRTGRERLIKDNEHYKNISGRMRETYEYAQKRYKVVQKRIFFDGQDNYFKVLSMFPMYCKMAFTEARQKYQRPSEDDDDCNGIEAVGHILKDAEKDAELDRMDHEHESEEEHKAHEHHHHHAHSQWRGPIVLGLFFFVILYITIASILSTVIMLVCSRVVKAFRSEEFKHRRACITLLCGDIIFALTILIANHFIHQNFLILASGLLLVFAWLLAAILFSILIHVKPEQIRSTLRTYMPLIVMGLIVITFRIIFIPNRLVNLVYPPMLLAFAIWQTAMCIKNRLTLRKSDRIFGWITAIVLGSTTVLSWAGYVLLGVQVFIWWMFQLAAAASVTAAYDILGFYQKKVMDRRIALYDSEHTVLNPKEKGAYIEVTWFYDFIKDTVLPVIAILTIPFCILHASDVFDLTELCKDYFFKPFVNLSDTDGNAILNLSLYKMVLVGSLFFVFRYVQYLFTSLYRHLRLQRIMEQSGNDFVHTNEVNLTLANNVIAIVVWGIYAIMAIVVLKIPMGAISIVAAGLATGIGLALKDVLNNFIYGIQLMSGRLRVGDYIDCDGVRGKVESITYQSTQILTLEGAIMAITNSTLFAKNFKNLTKNNAYECVKIPVGVAYGANVAHVREILSKAMEQMKTKDQFGRDIVDPKRGITIAFNDFGDSSVDLVVKQFVIVEEEVAYIAKAKEIIYNALNENGVEIPFPQRDIYIRQIAQPSQN